MSAPSKEYTAEVTLTIGGDEQNVTVRAHVAYEVVRHGGMGGELDGDIEAFIGGVWVDLDSLEIDPGDFARTTEVLEDLCANDDGGFDADEFDDRVSA